MRTKRAAAVSMVRGAVLVTLVALAGLAGAVAPGAARAQGLGAEPREVPVGTFGAPQNGFSIVEPPEGLPETKRGGAEDGSGRWFFESLGPAASPTDMAESLYNQAMQALEDGRVATAQRLFERLIADAPESKFTSMARQQLGRLYRADDAAPAGGPQAKSPVPAREALPWADGTGTAERTEMAAAKPALLGVVPALPQSVVQEARVAPALDEQFLSDAGDRVFFGAGSASLGTRAQGVIRAQARFLKRHPGLAAAVEGHADDGPLADAETLGLSQRRAAAVRERLIAEGVAAERLTAYGRGREERVSDCPAPECLAQNRRVITILLKGPLTYGPPAPRQAQGAGPEPAGAAPTQ